MSESFIEPESLNSTLVSLDAILDDDGAVRLLNKELSSYNFDGVIPTTASTILVSQLKVGMSFLPIGETEGALRTVVKIEFDDPEMTDTPSTDYIISYLSPSGDIQSITYDGSQNIEVYFEDWEDKVLGTKGWLITQEGNAIFSNVAVRGRIEATEGFLEDLGITGTLTVESGGSIVIGDNPGSPGNPGIIIDDTGIFAYDNAENETISINATTGEVLISALDQIIEDLEDYVQEEFDNLDLLLSSSYVANFQIFNPGTTLISGNKISTGVIDAANVNISSGGGGATQGIKITSAGLTAYNTLGNPTFFLNSSNGNATFTGTISGSQITGSTFKSNSTITANSGNGVYLDDFGQVRFADPDAILTFNANGLSITNSAANSTLTFDSTGLSLSGAGLNITGADINLSGGSLTSNEFSIDSSGNATFSGTLSAADGTFSGTLSGVDGTFEGTLSAGVSIDSPNITGGTITGGTFVSRSINNQTIGVGQSVAGWAYNAIAFNSGGSTVWRQALTVGGDILFSRVDGTSSNYVSVNGRIEVTGANARFEGNGSGLFGTATSLVAGRATNANILDSGATGGAQITGNNVQITSIGSSTTDEILRRNSSNQMRVGGTSTIRVKKDVSPIDDLNVLDINVVKFKYIDGYLDEEDQRNGEFIPGFIAEQMYEVLPIAVDLDKNGEPNNWNQRMLIPVMVKTIQDQQKIIDELKERLERLENNG